jgi:hypothetical protein
VLRGGAFNNEGRNVRAAYRNTNTIDNNNGFRVVVSTFFKQSRKCPAGAQCFFRDEAKNGGTRSWPRPRGGPGE